MEEFAKIICDILGSIHDMDHDEIGEEIVDAIENIGTVRSAKTFADAGVLTYDQGIVIETDDEYSPLVSHVFHITVSQVK